MLHRFSSVWFILECFYILFFSVEFSARLYGAPKRLELLKSVLGIIDILAVVPFYLAMILMAFAPDSSVHFAIVVRILRLVQLLRVIKLTRYSSGLRILCKSLKFCQEQIISLALSFAIAVVFSSSIVFLVEDLNNTGAFTDIPSTMWFCVISMTTVGYGDVVPKSAAGKIAATMSIFMGTVILFYLFLPIYLMYFTIFYASAQKEHKEQSKAEAEKKAAKLKQLEETRNTYMKQINTSALIAMGEDLELTVDASVHTWEQQAYWAKIMG